MATWWTDQATELAGVVGDDNLRAYILTRKSLMALYSRNHGLAIGLASAAASGAGTSPRTGWLAMQRLAQAHAMAGDAVLALRAADRAADLVQFSGRGGRSRREPHPTCPRLVSVRAWVPR